MCPRKRAINKINPILMNIIFLLTQYGKLEGIVVWFLYFLQDTLRHFMKLLDLEFTNCSITVVFSSAYAHALDYRIIRMESRRIFRLIRFHSFVQFVNLLRDGLHKDFTYFAFSGEHSH